jgi:DNA invertase Pin-like site-specific DNA recombinase
MASTLTAGIYARISVEDDRRAKVKSESIERQIEHAKAFAASKRWTVVATYDDDAVSGAVPARMRSGSNRMMAEIAEARRPPFDGLVVSTRTARGTT